MKWAPDVLDRFMAPRIYEFTDAKIIDVTTEFSSYRHWLANHFLNRVFRAKFRDEWGKIIFGFIWRAQRALIAFSLAREHTEEYLKRNEPYNPSIYRYYDIIANWEAFFIQTQIAMQLLKWINNENIFEKGGDSKEERCWNIANYIKHLSGYLEDAEGLESQHSTIWLSNEGIHSLKGDFVSYADAAALIREIARIAEQFIDPLSLKTSKEAE